MSQVPESSGQQFHQSETEWNGGRSFHTSKALTPEEAGPRIRKGRPGGLPPEEHNEDEATQASESDHAGEAE